MVIEFADTNHIGKGFEEKKFKSSIGSYWRICSEYLMSKNLSLLSFVRVLISIFFLGSGFPAHATQVAVFAKFEWAQAKLKAKKLPHPRSFPVGDETSRVFNTLLQGERRVGFAALSQRVDLNLASSSLSSLPKAITDARTPDQIAQLPVVIKNFTYKEVRSSQDAGFVALVSGNERYRKDAMARMLALAALDPAGETGVVREDLSAMLVARTLALGLDWFYTYWTPLERKQLLQAISVRMEDFSAKLIHGPRAIEKFPLDSHNNEVLGALAEISVLLLGEIALADKWFDEFTPLYAKILTPFGGDDGGYANGTAYGGWDVGEFSLRHWDTLKRVIGLDLTQKTWAKNFGRFLVYFVPPGTPVGLFGNAAEVAMPETWARYAKAYSYRVDAPLYRWYARQWFQEDPTQLELLTAPVPAGGDVSYPVGTANSAVFQSIGWAALHSDLQDRARTSFYFKSSPYGSVSHSHADQNSFVLNVAGRQLLIDSGYYDYYGSKHHYGWSTHTLAHNAITFDGGQGQENLEKPWGDASAKGDILQFSTSEDVDMVLGDASAAYHGKLKQASRGIVYLRPNMFVIFDKVVSALPHYWEWNLHALNRFDDSDTKNLIVRNADKSACINFYSSAPVKFKQTDSFTVPPLRTSSERRPDQWHGQYKTNNQISDFWSITVIRVDCSAVSVRADFNAANAKIKIGSREFEFDGQTLVKRK
ncbi:heparinase II/III domain-containing protein [Undibacterium parvum]|uniref:DUF4962 domain-containing protein n=2 Tax=Undibacterium TaxID=401469 RepID=A0A6M4A3Y4_9BURK|nr:heparinase II/III family protein [Undibacterium parvum]QJQ05510.1 DUF4962 domain-containing protein [Undibacterium piscinae]